MSALPEIDPKRIIAVGGSGGGVAVVALTVDPPPGLVGAINFAGVQGSSAPDTVCQPGSLLSTFWLLGKKSRVSMLWVYAQNDHVAPADLAQSLYEQFTEAGGKVTFVSAPPYGSEGHSLFTPGAISLWTPYVDNFLKAQGFVLRSRLLPLPAVPQVAVPAGLNESGREAFRQYLILPGEKAFAIDPRRGWGYEYGCRTPAEAMAAALEYCKKGGGRRCHIMIAAATEAAGQ